MTTGNVKLLFGSAVRTQRIELNISQEELADRAGLHRTYISDIERGERNLSLENIERLAHALELSVSTLFSRTGHGTGREPLMEILLIEDDPNDVALTARAFQKAKISNPLQVARDGAEALDFLFATGSHTKRKDQPLPGVILLDLNLPKVDGMEVLRRIKADQRTKGIPVVVLTISNQDWDIAACQRLGAESYIVKTVGFHNFSEVIPLLQMEWSLRKANPGPNGGKEGS